MYLILAENATHWAAGELLIADDAWTFNTLRLPYATQVRANGKSMAVQYENRKYITGQVSVPMLVDEYLRAFVLGIDPPHSAPTVAPAGAAAICYIRYVDELTGERSPLSAGTAVGAGPYTWTLPTQGYDVHPGTVTFAAGTVTGVGTSFGMMRPGDRVATSSDPTRYTLIRTIAGDLTMTVDDVGIASAGDNLYVKPALRTTHVEMWRAVSGGLPRFVQRAPLGLVTVVENVATLALGEAETSTFTKMPYGTISAIYHDRLAIAGDPENPSLVYLSAQFYPERYEGLYYRTRSGRPVIALLTVRDHLLVMTDRDAEILQGYTEEDMTMEVKDPEIGALSQHLTMTVHGDGWIVTSKGWFMYNGEFHQMCSARLSEWKLLASVYNFSSSHMYYNSFDQTVQVVMPNASGPWSHNPYRDQVWVADISQVSALVGGGYTQPRWFNDAYIISASDVDRSTTALLYPDNISIPSPRIFAFSVAGEVCREMQDWVESYGGTYSDGILGNMIIETPIYLMGDVGGDIQEGKNLTRFWLYCKKEYEEGTLELFGGDEFALWRNLITRDGNNFSSLGEDLIFNVLGGDYYPTPTANWSDTIPATVIVNAQVLGIRKIAAAKIIHPCVPEKVSGRGFAMRLTVASPRSVYFIGFGGQYKPGVSGRGYDGELQGGG